MSSASTGTDEPDDIGVPDDRPGGPNDRRAAAKWRDARVVEVAHPAVDAVVLRLAVPERVQHHPGQHYVVRLRAPDGYTAQRSYSVASAPADDLVELFVERIDDGEVSTYLADVVEPGDDLEVRGPIGRWFVWSGYTRAIGIGGGSGVAPLVGMLRHAHDVGRTERLRLAVSATTRDRLPYADELEAAGAHIALTRSPGEPHAGRLDMSAVAALVDPEATVYLCGSARFTGAMETLLVDAGQPAGTIRVERFGPTG
ncbi:FAD-binding oxidoreductase [Actinomycetospora lemnae]|uniref:FAD-binding oxidoreductase n=1 Tax=Actinomycetospora lemnae TaxID=3019891 RepID=A0ABT5SMC0_9PSEU|nr:FAD-binding oxidoreductase [Actinomycetospora sp. DW7H6]MDD7963988.1 FAD-binding oxidoreductase [Actinomycetospora sp. DW7H6]